MTETLTETEAPRERPADDAEVVLRVDDIHSYYGAIHALKGISLEVRKGEVVKRGIAHSPEGRRLFPRMSVMENLEMGAFQKEDRSTFREDLERVFTLLSLIHI